MTSRTDLSDTLTTQRVAYLALGSNLGERRTHIEDAIERLETHTAIEVVARATIITTPAMYITEQPDFLNTCIGIRTTLQPHDLLDVCLAVEQAMGRVRSVDKGPRLIDVDIVLYEDLVLEDERLTIPHPAMLERDFVIIPLAEIAGDVVHPVTGETIAHHRGD